MTPAEIANKNNNVMNRDETAQPDLPEKRPTIGEEFIQWAEHFWHLHEMKLPDTPGAEIGHYKIMREAFIHQINGIIHRRIVG